MLFCLKLSDNLWLFQRKKGAAPGDTVHERWRCYDDVTYVDDDVAVQEGCCLTRYRA